MGIYGVAHTGLDAMNLTNTVACMANQIGKHYGSIVRSEVVKDNRPYRIDKIDIGGKVYDALYFGSQGLRGAYKSRAFWRLEKAYEDFKDNSKTHAVLPYNNYPMEIETGQVFVIDYMNLDGSVLRAYYRSDGDEWNNMLSTVEFIID